MAKNLTFTYTATETVPLKVGNKFSLPIKSLTDLEIGAISMIINYPSEYIKINDIVLKEQQNMMMFHCPDKDRNGNPLKDQLRIGWYTATNIAIKATSATSFLNVEFEVIKDFGENESLKFTITDDIENELATKMGQPIPDVVLQTTEFINSAVVTAPAKNISFTYTTTEKVELKVGNKFSLPMTSMEDLQIEAISMIVEYPEEFIKINDILMPDANTANLMFNPKDSVGDLRISWYSIPPLAITSAKHFLSIEFEVIKDFGENESLKFIMSKSNNTDLKIAGQSNIDVVLQTTEFINSATPVVTILGKTVKIRKAYVNYTNPPPLESCIKCNSHDGIKRCTLLNCVVAKGGKCKFYTP